MNFIKFLLITISSVSAISLNGKYCANLFGNIVNTSFSDNYVNASANVFGEE